MSLQRRLTIALLAASLAITLAGCGDKKAEDNANTQGSATADVAPENEETKTPKQWKQMPEMSIDTNKSYEAHFVTSKGEFTIELFAKDAPQTVNSFVFLAKEKYFEGIKFHRVLSDFMIQTGDPLGTGSGGPGYNIPDELDNGHVYEEGTVAMANTMQPDSGGSQFFIGTGEDVKGLDMQPIYTIFGKISSGMDTIKAIDTTPVGPGNPDRQDSKPLEDITITSVTINEK
ncbi:hypothetical protein PAECIP111893_00613 [Paenibacillus plantiphilus]|uniref:Peptidyl-prolyl cis-trans isomerase n=1 Tax=Paenibacillus plantiphilus TaxID=2905650 RepID=A0ABM9BWT9_9BACL|nr:peptidylprolyl isomerase [Paenibacillus plantiphilus]CAH1195101.1 hypothetical protein PAECIP111893_00613 [Paenibacillus plantiphilus]